MEFRECPLCGEKRDAKKFYTYSFCRECQNERNRSLYKIRINQKLITRYKNYRHKDIKNNYPNTISKDKAIQLMQTECYWCKSVVQLGLDRIDNNKGHSEDNIVVCCNQIRNNIPFEAMECLKPGLIEIEIQGLLKKWIPPYKRSKQIIEK